MSERWKFQIKSGLPFVILMPIFTSLIDWMDSSFSETFFSLKFLIRVIVFALVGVFLIGYFNWKEMKKQEETK